MHQQIIENQRNPLIFERFCAQLISKSENVKIVTTSFNYDRGIDARSVQPSRGQHPLILCVTLARELDPKISSDIIKLLSRSSPETIYYCSSIRLTEDACHKLVAEIRLLANKPISVRVLGSIQLADISQEHPEVLKDNFRTEIENIEAIFQSRNHRDSDSHGLRLACMAFGSEDAQQLRSQMSCRMVLDAIALGETTEEAIANRITKDFALPRPLDGSYISQILRTAALHGLVTQNSTSWGLSESGRAEIKQVSPESAANLLEGKTKIRDTLESLIGKSIADDQFERVWATLLDGFADLFHSNGLGIVTAISSFLQEGTESPIEDLHLPRLITQIGSRLRHIFSSEELGIQVVTAMKDMFTERNGPAFDWIAKVSERFVIMCSLGLETTSSDEIKKLMTRSLIVLDTDIVLTLLCESEPDHVAVKELVTNWKRLNGRFLLSMAVMEEVAYHAWISENDFRGSRSLLGTLRGIDLRRYSENAFVRAFHSKCKSRAEGQFWSEYIDQFRGSTFYDYSNIRRELAQILSGDTLTDAVDSTLESEIASKIYNMKTVSNNNVSTKQKDDEALRREEMKNKEFIDKAKRDGRVMASIATGRHLQEQLGTDKTVVLISSSKKLQMVVNGFRSQFSFPNPVISLGAWSYMISLIPNVRFGPDTLRRSLFEFGESAKLKDHERLALRVIKGTGLYELAWASRSMLARSLNKVLHSEAAKRDMPTSEFRRKFAAGNIDVDPAAIIASSLATSSIPSAVALEVDTLRRQLKDAQIELDFLRTQGTTKEGKRST